ncbi:HAD family hydrolase [Algibacillus agarilyticus]|uniref:HAD family hydrolase n=1 Tax=Algibacillus agarilyticus TaxID=2234133 RepID=UPI000DD0AD0B|nr:HAD-IB family hydrolase [Algibacillus agarilyticus]
MITVNSNPLFSDVINKAAFFDVDDTLINIKTMFSFLNYLKTHDPWAQTVSFNHFDNQLSELMTNGTRREDVNRFYYKMLKGMPVADLEMKASEWFKFILLNHRVLNEQVVSHLNSHQNLNHDVVFVSGSCLPLLKPLGDLLGVHEFICAPLEIINGIYNGELKSSPTIGEGKAKGLKKYAAAHELNLNNCFAYGDDISDIPMLNSVGEPRLINPNNAMLASYQSKNSLSDNCVIRF